MTLPGGAADKLGNRHEKWWTLSVFVRMFQGYAEAIRIEEPGTDKAEFVVTTGTCRELHQVKRSHPKGKWSLAALRADGLLDAIGKRLAGNEDRFVFASTSDARELSDLCKAARDAQSPDEFKVVFLKGGAPDTDDYTGAADGPGGAGSKVALKPWSRRTAKSLGYQAPDGTPAPLIDQAHRLMHLWRAGDEAKVNDYLDDRGLKRHALFARAAAGLDRAGRRGLRGTCNPGIAFQSHRRPCWGSACAAGKVATTRRELLIERMDVVCTTC